MCQSRFFIRANVARRSGRCDRNGFLFPPKICNRQADRLHISSGNVFGARVLPLRCRSPNIIHSFFFIFFVSLINSCCTSWIGQAWQTSPWPFLWGKLSREDSTAGCQKAIIQKHKSATRKLIRKHSETVGALAEATPSSSTQKCHAVFTRRSDCKSNVLQSTDGIVTGQINFRPITATVN